MARGRPALPITLTGDERDWLERAARRWKVSHALAERARIILKIADGQTGIDVANTVGVTNSTVSRWRARFLEFRLAGLGDAPRAGRPRTIDDDAVEECIRCTLEDTPKNATHWSTRSMAARIRFDKSTVSRIWRTFGLRPHAYKTYSLSTDPEFVAKVHDVVGLYLNPPHGALVLSVDEKPSVQALDRRQPMLPLFPGQEARGNHDYVRCGTTDLIAALNVATGAVIGKCYPRHTAVEFRKFLDHVDASIPPELTEVHVIMDNLSTHKTDTVRHWFLKRPRYHVHFTPTHASWLNQIEIWFSILHSRQLKRGVHRSTKDLRAAIEAFITDGNEHPRPFKWTRTAEQILGSVARLAARIRPTKPTEDGGTDFSRTSETGY